MPENYTNVLRERLDDENYEKLMALPNPKLHGFIAEAIELCNPESVFVVTDAPEDIAKVRQLAIDFGEELPLVPDGHTIHFDGFRDFECHDQGRDKENTKYLVPPRTHLGANLNTADREEGLAEVREQLQGSMTGRPVFVRFFSLGPTDSIFSISGVQLTDSAYVAHSEDLLFRPGYEQFKKLGESSDFFRVLHSAGELENAVTVHVDKRRIYIDLQDECVYSVNTQYAGNTIGFKKLCLRLAIRKADREGWLSEHMFVMGVHGPGGRVTYFTGAFPSFCGKTSTAMLPGETIIGDDLAYIRNIDDEARAVNVENGIFGVIANVNPKDDPVIYDVLKRPGEVIFSNVLVKDAVPYWQGMGIELPADGVNYSGKWHQGKTDSKGHEIAPSHKNARYTIALATLANLDERANDPDGVPIRAVIYGGRDSDTSVPVLQSFHWAHGVITTGAGLESETTAATIGQEGVRMFQPMSNLDFVSIPLGKYVKNHLDFGEVLTQPPLIFAVNYFLKGKDGKYLNAIPDKRVWAKWMELRVHGDAGAITTPTGHIPLCEDIQRLFREFLGKDYTEDDYVEQFMLRIPENLRKLERIEKIYRTQVSDTPELFFDVLAAQRKRLLAVQAKHGDYVSPFTLMA